MLERYALGALQLGMDNRIYIAQSGENALGVIANPDTLGVGCNLTFGPLSPPLGLPLAPGSTCRLGLPNLIADKCPSKTCAEIGQDQDAYLHDQCAKKVNLLPRVDCDHPDIGVGECNDCRCDCVAIKLPDIEPCISVKWGDSRCDCMETNDLEVLCITVCNCYSNVTFNDLTIGHIQITDMAGNPVPPLPDGTPSVQVIPSGPICFGDIGPCKGKNQPSCVSRELVLYTCGAIGKDYKLSFEGVCFTVSHEFQSEQCFVVKLCQD